MSLPHSEIKTIIKTLVAHGQTLSFAESCTGGLLSSWFTREPGVSQIFWGSVISYHRDVKEKQLNVPLTLMQALGEVSVPVALAMARGVRSRLNTNWSVAITGIAGPSGGSAEKPVGTVCFAIIGPGVEFSEQKQFDPSADRIKIQEQSARHAVEALYRLLVPARM